MKYDPKSGDNQVFNLLTGFIEVFPQNSGTQHSLFGLG